MRQAHDRSIALKGQEPRGVCQQEPTTSLERSREVIVQDRWRWQLDPLSPLFVDGAQLDRRLVGRQELLVHPIARLEQQISTACIHPADTIKRSERVPVIEHVEVSADLRSGVEIDVIDRNLLTIDVGVSLVLEQAALVALLVEARGIADDARDEASHGLDHGHDGDLAAVNSTSLSDGAVLDIGGGSAQIVAVSGRRPLESASWRLGAVRMTERFLPGDKPATKKQMEKLRAHVRGKLEKAPWISSGGDRLVGVGGTVRNLAAAVQRADDLPIDGVQGQVVTAKALDALIERLADLPPHERGDVRGVKPARADVILAGALVVREVMETGGFPAIEATEAGLREGIFFAHHLADRGDVPLFEDVRAASVLNLAGQYDTDPSHTGHVAHLALGLFDDLAEGGLHPGDPVERELLWAACALHDIGVAVDYDDHHKHTRYLVLHAQLPGYTPRELALIAQAARYHRKGMPEPGPLAGVFEKGDAEMLDRLAVLLRLAEDLERSRDQAVRAVEVDVRKQRVHLTLLADEAIEVPRWAARRENALFARAFGRELVVD